jgi:hypothetical protein
VEAANDAEGNHGLATVRLKALSRIMACYLADLSPNTTIRLWAFFPIQLTFLVTLKF